jgi:hypothetical protein
MKTLMQNTEFRLSSNGGGRTTAFESDNRLPQTVLGVGVF